MATIPLGRLRRSAAVKADRGGTVTRGSRISGGEAARRPPLRKLSIPPEDAGHFHRSRLIEAAMPTRRRLTVLKAPAGFGKTALLAECCRKLAASGVPTAWISLSDSDTPAMLDASIALACTTAGLELRNGANWRYSDRAALRGAALVIDVLEKSGGDFVLALDEVDLLKDPGSSAWLRFLLEHSPPNLRVAMTCREIPENLDVGAAFFEGQATILGPDDLCFSKSEVVEFTGMSGLKIESDKVAFGWPIALRVARDAKSERKGSGEALGDAMANWMDSRIFGRLSAENRNLLFDLGLFEWFDAQLLGKVLRTSYSPRQFVGLMGLQGLLKPAPGRHAERWRLHPLIRRHCGWRRLRDNSKRYMELHRHLATAYMSRGETVTAMRHAAAAGDATLVGDILEDAGAVGMRIRQGVPQIIAADRLLNDEITAERPRLRLFRALASTLSGHFNSARKSAAEAVSMNESGSGADFALDDFFVRCELALCGGERFGRDHIRGLRTELDRLREAGEIDPLILAHLEFRLAAGCGLAGEFELARALADAARNNAPKDAFLGILADLELGLADMAQGRHADAENRYSRARTATREWREIGAESMAASRILLEELALERNRLAPQTHMLRAPRMLALTARSLSVHAAANSIAVELRLRYSGADIALKTAEDLIEFFRGLGAPAPARHAAALRMQLIAAQRQAEDAEREWRRSGLPQTPAECLDLASQTWREMEALSCARLRLLSALKRFDEGREFAARLRAAAAASGLTRTLMRALSLSVALERLAGDDDAALALLNEFLRLFAATPYSWSMVRDQQINRPVVEAFADSASDARDKRNAVALLTEMRDSDQSGGLLLNKRELQVLEHIGRFQDKEIARILGLSPFGVRYHIRKIFAKLDVANREDADRRARELGVLIGKPEHQNRKTDG